MLLGALALLVLSAVGTAGYVLIEGWSAFDAFYMTFITLTTIGFAEVHPVSTTGRLFTVVLAAVGIGTYATVAARAIQLLVSTPTFRQRAMQRRIEHLQGHYVVCGYGRLGQRLVRDLMHGGRDVVVVDRRDDRAAQLEAAGLPYVMGDAEDEAVLRAAGLERAAGLVLVLPLDAANVFVALTAREVRPEHPPDGLLVVARTNEQTSVPKLLRSGVDKVISPIEIGADRMAQTILRPNVDRFIEHVLGVGTLDSHMEEAHVLPGALLDGRSLAEVDFRRRFDAIVVAVLCAADGGWRFNPEADQPLAAGDTLIVLGPPDTIRRVRREGCSAGVPPQG